MTVIRRHAPTWLCEVEVTSWSLSVEGQLSCRRTFLGVCTQPPCLESGAGMPSCRSVQVEVTTCCEVGLPW